MKTFEQFQVSEGLSTDRGFLACLLQNGVPKPQAMKAGNAALNYLIHVWTDYTKMFAETFLDSNNGWKIAEQMVKTKTFDWNQFLRENPKIKSRLDNFQSVGKKLLGQI